MSEELRTRQFWASVTAIFAGLAILAARALSGGSATGNVSTFSNVGEGAGIVFDISSYTGAEGPEGFTRLLREVFLDVDANVLQPLEEELRSTGTKVPKDTGYLRQSVQVFISPDGTKVVARWPVAYATYLWQDYVAGYVSQSGLARHGETTYPDWSEWAKELILPRLAEGFAQAFRARGIEARVTT